MIIKHCRTRGRFFSHYDHLDYMNIMGTCNDMNSSLAGKRSTYGTLTTPASSSLRALRLLALLICCIIPSIFMLQEYEFRIGSNATITFNHRLTDILSTYECEIFALDIQRPFFLNGKIDERSLKTSQRGRFEVHMDSSDNTINISLCIKNIQKDDSDVYIINFREYSSGTEKNDIYDAYIEVTFPPGKADCNIHPSEYYDEWSEIHCHAESGSADGGGSLLCFQDGIRTPHLQPVQVEENRISAVFWVRTYTNITCCSAENDYHLEPRSCKDFINVTHIPRRGSILVFSPKYIPAKPTLLNPTYTNISFQQNDSIDNHGNKSTDYSVNTECIVWKSMVGLFAITNSLLAALFIICFCKKTRGKHGIDGNDSKSRDDQPREEQSGFLEKGQTLQTEMDDRQCTPDSNNVNVEDGNYAGFPALFNTSLNDKTLLLNQHLTESSDCHGTLAIEAPKRFPSPKLNRRKGKSPSEIALKYESVPRDCSYHLRSRRLTGLSSTGRTSQGPPSNPEETTPLKKIRAMTDQICKDRPKKMQHQHRKKITIDNEASHSKGKQLKYDVCI